MGKPAVGMVVSQLGMTIKHVHLHRTVTLEDVQEIIDVLLELWWGNRCGTSQFWPTTHFLCIHKKEGGGVVVRQLPVGHWD